MTVPKDAPRGFDVYLEYNRLLHWWEAETRPVSSRAWNDNTAKVMSKYMDWCEEHEVPPVEFLQARICWNQDMHGTMPRFTALASKKLLGLQDDNDEDWTLWEHYRDRQVQYEDDEKMQLRDFQTQREERKKLLVFSLPHSQERYKAGFHSRRVCALDTQHTGGYHPQSLVCQKCDPEAVRTCTARTIKAYGREVWDERMRVLPSEVIRF